MARNVTSKPYINAQPPSLVEAVGQDSLVSSVYLQWIASVPSNLDVMALAQWIVANPKPPMIDMVKLAALEKLRDEVTTALQTINEKITSAYTVIRQ